jgi:hypothetical protein
LEAGTEPGGGVAREMGATLRLRNDMMMISVRSKRWRAKKVEIFPQS